MSNVFNTGLTQSPDTAQFTGRYLILYRNTLDTNVPRALRDRAGLTMASASDFPSSAVDAARLNGADGIYFEQLGVAVTSPAPDQLTALTRGTASDGILATERERVVYIDVVPPRDYTMTTAPAFAGAIAPESLDTDIILCGLAAPSGGRVLADADRDEATATWGLKATRALYSSRTGRGIRVAVIDTGLDLQHPDFAGRSIVSHSFVAGEAVQDRQNHGTHCAGTAVGTARPHTLPRYGIASGAEIYIGKSLSNSGSGTDGSILAGINWAVTNRCRIVSMSIGSPVEVGEKYSIVYEAAAQRALAANTLIIATAGNRSRRPDLVKPVGAIAGCPSIMAVAAIDANMQVASFSNGGLNRDGGSVDIAGPGVDVYSTVPMPGRYGRMDGTSMACPHVSGIAALYAEARPNLTAKELWQVLVTTAKRLPFDAVDVGAGLVQAPE